MSVLLQELLLIDSGRRATLLLFIAVVLILVPEGTLWAGVVSPRVPRWSVLHEARPELLAPGFRMLMALLPFLYIDMRAPHPSIDRSV